jgi:hypothetical protein
MKFDKILAVDFNRINLEKKTDEWQQKVRKAEKQKRPVSEVLLVNHH